MSSLLEDNFVAFGKNGNVTFDKCQNFKYCVTMVSLQKSRCLGPGTSYTACCLAFL